MLKYNDFIKNKKVNEANIKSAEKLNKEIIKKAGNEIDSDIKIEEPEDYTIDKIVAISTDKPDMDGKVDLTSEGYFDNDGEQYHNTPYSYVYCCVNAPNLDELDTIVDGMEQITLEEFLQYVPKKQFLTDFHNLYKTINDVKKDYGIGFYKYKDENIDAVIFLHSAIEYIYKKDGTYNESYMDATPLTTDLNLKNVAKGDTLYITAVLTPKTTSALYKPGRLGVLKVRVLDLYYDLNKLKFNTQYKKSQKPVKTKK